MQYFVKTFGNLASFSRFLDETEVNKEIFRYQESVNGTKSFTSTENFEEAARLMQYGDEKNAGKIINVTAPGKIQCKDIKPRRERSLYGGSVNIGAVVTGRPKTMYRNVMQKVPARVLTFVYNTSVSWMVSASDIANTAASLTSAICGLEKRVIGSICMLERFRPRAKNVLRPSSKSKIQKPTWTGKKWPIPLSIHP